MPDQSNGKSTSIQIDVELDPKNIPRKIAWSADDQPGGKAPQECKAMLLAFFDKEHKETVRIDLWTQDMQVVEMDRFFFQTLRSMADTYFKATQNAGLASDMQRFVQYFGEKTEIIPGAGEKGR